MQSNPLTTLSVQQLKRASAIRQQIDALEKELDRFIGGQSPLVKRSVPAKKDKRGRLKPSVAARANAMRFDYSKLFAGVKHRSVKAVRDMLLEQLPEYWRTAYLAMTPRETDICCIPFGSFQYIFDDYATLVASGKVAGEPSSESRLVAVIGRSKPQRVN